MNGKKIDFKYVENLARANQWEEVEKLILGADRQYFLPNDLLKLATLARRAYRLSFASYLLRPLVLDPDHQILLNASPTSSFPALSDIADKKIKLFLGLTCSKYSAEVIP